MLPSAPGTATGGRGANPETLPWMTPSTQERREPAGPPGTVYGSTADTQIRARHAYRQPPIGEDEGRQRFRCGTGRTPAWPG